MAIKTIVLDLAGVLSYGGDLTDRGRGKSDRAATELHEIRHHPIWHDFEAGRM